jgi:hypothetical protein
MRLRLRLAEHYGCSLYSNSVEVALPKSLAAGTVSDLAAYVAQGFCQFLRPQGAQKSTAASINIKVTSLFVDGFALPSTEAISKVLRETDEVIVCVEQSATPQLCEAAEETYQYDSTEEARQAREMARLAEARAEDLAKLTEVQAAKLKALELQVVELSRQLAACRSRNESCQSRKVSELSLDVSRASAVSSSTRTKEAHSPSKKRRLERPEDSWQRIASGAELEPGDVIRYHILLIDGWSGQFRRSPKRIASVTKTLPGKDGMGPLLVLRHEDGAVDCVEASRLRGLRVRIRDR